MTLSNEQNLAIQRMIDFIDDKEPVLVLQGPAGTGKSSCLKEYVQYLDSTDINFTLCAPTHKAKMVIEEITEYDAVTVHKLLSLSPNIEIFNLDYSDLKFYSKGVSAVPTNGIVIIDECSMINDEIYRLLLEFCASRKSKLLFIGDICQLQAVNNKSVSKVFDCKNKIILTEIHRQSDGNGIMPILANLRENAMDHFKTTKAENGSLFVFRRPKDFMLKAYEYFNNAIHAQNITEVKLAAYTNARVRGLNSCIRRMLWKDDKEYHQFEFLTGYENFEYNHNQFYNSLDYIITSEPKKIERRIPHFMKLPGYELELYDKVYKQLLDVFIIDSDINQDYIDSLAVIMEDFRISAIECKNYNRTRSSKLWKQYFEVSKSFATPFDIMFDNRVIKKKTFDYGYASSVHKLQGSTLNNVFIDMDNIFICKDKSELRQLQYVALSRTRKDAFILLK